MKLERSHLEQRRTLCGLIGGGAVALGAGAIFPLLEYVADARHTPLPDFLVLERDQFDLAPGKSRLLMYGPVPVLLFCTKEPESQLRIFVATCTHLNCTVGYREDLDRIFCACHEGYFDTSGRVLAGPPPRPLQTMFSKVKDGKLIIAIDEAKLASASG